MIISKERFLVDEKDMMEAFLGNIFLNEKI